LDEKQFAGLFGCRPSDLQPDVRSVLHDIDARYRTPDACEYLDYVGEYFGNLQRREIRRTARRNREIWLAGWRENLQIVERKGASLETCRPRYFRKSRFLRLRRGIVVSPNPMLEYDLFEAARRHIFHSWLEPFKHVHELGCGSGSNLFLLSEMFPEKEIAGYDWVVPPVEIAREIGRQKGRKVRGVMLNMLRPGNKLRLGRDSAVVTVHAMEQLGTSHEPIIHALIKARPGLVVNYEPIIELYDDRNVFDSMAIWYTRVRNYLAGYLTRLRELEKRKKIEIVECHRPGLGGVYHEASLVVWRPR